MSDRVSTVFPLCESANQNAKSGSGKRLDATLLAGALWLRWAALRIRPWIYYVNTYANWADDPSRRFTSGLRAHGATRLPFAAPRLPNLVVGDADEHLAAESFFPPFAPSSEF